MQRVVIDTNIYIDCFHAGRHEDVLFQRDAVKHLSAVVFALQNVVELAVVESRERPGIGQARRAVSGDCHR